MSKYVIKSVKLAIANTGMPKSFSTICTAENSPTSCAVPVLKVRRRPMSSVTLASAWCAARLSDYKVPETIAVSAEPLPRNANGKVMKKVLREAMAHA